MARPALPTFDLFSQFHYIVVDSGGTPRGQIQDISVEGSVDSSQVGRVGSSTKKTLNKSVAFTCTMNIFPDGDLDEVAWALGETAAPAVDATVKLSPDLPARDFEIWKYDSEDPSATRTEVHQITGWVAQSLSFALSDGEPVMSFSGTVEDWEFGPVSS